MRIADARSVILSHRVDPDDPMVWVGGQIVSWDAALVELTADDGTTGLGEVAQGIMAAPAVPGMLEALRPYLLGLDLNDPSSVADQLRAKTCFWSRGGISSGLIGALEVAAWDIAGKRAGRPTYKLMGGRPRRIEAYASGGLGTTFDQVGAWVKEQQALGFRTVKFRAMANPNMTIDLVDHLMPLISIGNSAILDAVQGCAGRPWPLAEAIRVGKHLEGLPIRWYEEPRRVDDIEGYVEVRKQVDVPVAGAESLANADDFLRLIKAGGLDVAQPDVSMIGGPSEFRRVASAAVEAGVKPVPHVWGSGVTVMANLHTCLATEGVELFEVCTLSNPLRDDLLVEPLRVNESRIEPPTSPGLGLQLTPELEDTYRFVRGGGHVIA